MFDLRNDGADYILGWDANTPYDSDDIQDFLQDHDMVDDLLNSSKTDQLLTSMVPSKSI
jgi:hypothetical protein